MNLSLEFRGLGTYSVELQNVTAADYTDIERYFVPLLNSPRIKAREAICAGFDFAIARCPKENPSDIWHHILYRIYTAKKIGTDPAQSWVRTSGEAFELFLTRRYNSSQQLQNRKIRLTSLISKTEKEKAIGRMGLTGQIGSSKIDVLIEQNGRGSGVLADGYGVVGGLHVKVSLAERVSDDIPASRIMMKGGFLSLLSTLDVKSFPPPHGDLINRGELGTMEIPSDKRRYVEQHGDFDACFSYNYRSIPSSGKTESNKKIYVVDLQHNPDDFVSFLLSRCPQ